jgi:hypothetical protein
MGSSLAFPGHERSKHMGELKRGDEHWNVYLEMQPDTEVVEGGMGKATGAVRGRIHFVARDRHRMTGWVFLEWQERDIQERFGEFSAVELWHFLEALED